VSTIKTDTITAVNAGGDLSLDGLGAGGVSIASTLKMTKGGDIASASPLVIDTDGNYFDVTGTTSFAAMTVAAGNFFMLQFDGALTITHGSGIEIPGAANLTTAAGDRLICYATAANTVEVMSVATEASALTTSSFAAGTRMLFQQTLAPTGWTKDATHNNKAVRLQTGTVGTGGTDSFTTVFGTSKTTSSHTLATSEMPAHTHDVKYVSFTHASGSDAGQRLGAGFTGNLSARAVTTGGGSGHTHNLTNLDLEFVDFIIASKN